MKVIRFTPSLAGVVLACRVRGPSAHGGISAVGVLSEVQVVCYPSCERSAGLICVPGGTIDEREASGVRFSVCEGRREKLATGLFAGKLIPLGSG